MKMLFREGPSSKETLSKDLSPGKCLEEHPRWREVQWWSVYEQCLRKNRRP